MSRIGALFADQLQLCPWQSSLCAMGKGEFKDKLKQNRNLFPAKISCVSAFAGCLSTMMHLLWHLIPGEQCCYGVTLLSPSRPPPPRHTVGIVSCPTVMLCWGHCAEQLVLVHRGAWDRAGGCWGSAALGRCRGTRGTRTIPLCAIWSCSADGLH